MKLHAAVLFVSSLTTRSFQRSLWGYRPEWSFSFYSTRWDM